MHRHLQNRPSLPTSSLALQRLVDPLALCTERKPMARRKLSVHAFTKQAADPRSPQALREGALKNAPKLPAEHVDKPAVQYGLRVHHVLWAAWRIVEDHWCKGAWYIDPNTRCELSIPEEGCYFSVDGAVKEAIVRLDYAAKGSMAFEALERAALEVLNAVIVMHDAVIERGPKSIARVSVVNWNDHPMRTPGDVRRLFTCSLLVSESYTERLTEELSFAELRASNIAKLQVASGASH